MPGVGGLPIKELIIIVFLLALLITASVLIVLSDARMTRDGAEEVKAHTALRTASIIGWVSTGVLISAAIALAVFGPELLESPFAGIVLTLVYWMIIIIVTVCGVYAAMGASDMAKGPNAKGSNKKYLKYTIIATILCLIIAFGIFVYYCVKMYTNYKHKKEVKEYPEKLRQWQLEQLQSAVQYKKQKMAYDKAQQAASGIETTSIASRPTIGGISDLTSSSVSNPAN